MTSRPAAPESETPEVDALFEEFINAGGEKDVIDYHAIMRKLDLLARSLERRLSLAQTEIERERMRVVGCSVAALGNWREGDSLHADYDCAAIRDVAKLRVKYDEAQARIAELEKALLEFVRLDEESELCATDGGELVSALHDAKVALKARA